MLYTTYPESSFTSSPGYALFLRSIVNYVVSIVKQTKDMKLLDKILEHNPTHQVANAEEFVLDCLNSNEYEIVSGILELVDVLIMNNMWTCSLEKGIINFVITISIRHQCYSKVSIELVSFLSDIFKSLSDWFTLIF